MARLTFRLVRAKTDLGLLLKDSLLPLFKKRLFIVCSECGLPGLPLGGGVGKLLLSRLIRRIPVGVKSVRGGDKDSKRALS